MKIHFNSFIDILNDFIIYNLMKSSCMRKVEQFVVDISLKSLNYDLYEEMKTPGGECLSRNK